MPQSPLWALWPDPRRTAPCRCRCYLHLCVCSLCTQCLIFNVGLVSALLKALLLRRFIELAGLFIHCLPSLVPWIAVSTGWGQKIVCACALSHILTSLVLLGTGAYC